jgi:hypothetical protein
MISPLSWLPIHKPPIPSPLPPPLCLCKGALPPHPSLVPHCSNIPLCWGIKPPQDQGSPLPLMSHKAIFYYICGWSHRRTQLYSLVGGLVPGSSGGSGYLIMLFFLWGYNRLQLLHSFPHLFNWLAVSIYYCICQALAQPLRRQHYTRLLSANTSWHQQ